MTVSYLLEPRADNSLFSHTVWPYILTVLTPRTLQDAGLTPSATLFVGYEAPTKTVADELKNEPKFA